MYRIIAVNLPLAPRLRGRFFKGRKNNLSFASPSIRCPTKMAKITIPKEGYTYFPDDKPEMYTIGGSEMFAGSKVDTANMPKDHNKGRHRIYTGGKYDSFLYVPIIPEN